MFWSRLSNGVRSFGWFRTLGHHFRTLGHYAFLDVCHNPILNNFAAEWLSALAAMFDPWATLLRFLGRSR